MKQPLALVLYEKLIPGSQLVNRLQDLNYRVQITADPAQLAPVGKAEKPLLIFADLDSSSADVCSAIASLHQNRATAHIPIIAFADEEKTALISAAQKTGAAVVVSDAAVLAHLPQLLERALQVE